MKQYGTENISGPGYFYNVHIQLHWLRTSSWNISEPNYFWKTHIHTWFTPLQCIDMDNQSAWNMEHTTRLFLEYLMYIVQCTITCTWFAPSWCINIVHIRAKLFLECSCFAPICTIVMHWYGSTLNSQHGTCKILGSNYFWKILASHHCNIHALIWINIEHIRAKLLLGTSQLASWETRTAAEHWRW